MTKQLRKTQRSNTGADALDDTDVPKVNAHQVELVSKSQTHRTQEDEEDLVHGIIPTLPMTRVVYHLLQRPRTP